VVVVGAGIIGAAIADALVARGAGVTVLDRRSPGRGASQASAGILAPFAEGRTKGPLLDLGRRSLDLFDGFVDGARKRSGMPVEYSRAGTLDIALNEDEAGRLGLTRSWLEQEGLEHDWVTGDRLRALEPTVSSAAVAGLLIPAHGFVAVEPLVRALVHGARLAGAVFEAPVEAVSVDDRGSSVVVQAGGRSYEADAVVLAAGSWTGRVRIRQAPRFTVRPIRGQLLYLRWSDEPRPSRVVWGADCYVVPWADGTVLVGATVEDVGFDESATVEGVAALTRAANELLPGAASATFEAVRVGLRPDMPDGLPAIGPLDEASNVVVATGHYRNGILLAPLTARVVARFLLDGHHDASLALTNPGRALIGSSDEPGTGE
jgi:glycine oxidase